MKILFDTSTLLAALLQSHPAHGFVLPWLKQAQTRAIEGIVGAHTLAELFNKLTIVPMPRPVLANEAEAMLKDGIERHFQIVHLEAADYFAVIEDLVARSLTGGIIYDALILRAGVKANADRILTLNAKHFRRIDPALADRIFDPSTPTP
ncbi:MAG: PIN domain-containing protein [Caldilineaceae bacterium]|nr:PIN domain-containing protein [Caldilineaceae bacterium]HRJ43129.1 PIN domain-containing protein [Caldilineaceae bacterium]